MTIKKVLVSQTAVYQSVQKYRDEMLENLLHKTLQRMSSRLSQAIHEIERSALAHLARLRHTTHMSGAMQSRLFEQEVEVILTKLIPELTELYERLARWSQMLATTAEFEAISQAQSFTHRAIHAKPNRNVVTSQGYQIGAALEVYLAELRRKIADAFDMSRIRKDDPGVAMERIRRAFPSIKRVPKRVLTKTPKSLQEADDKKVAFTTGIVDEDDWKNMVEEFRDDYVPDYRDPRLAEETDEGIYDWKFEQDTTQKLVERVREGQVQAANELGVQDFIWIAVVDKVTDDCCLKRDGLTTKQIEAKLAGEWKDDEDQSAYPPLHWNCRCTIAPLADTVEPQPPFDEEDFNSWLMS